LRNPLHDRNARACDLGLPAAPGAHWPSDSRPLHHEHPARASRIRRSRSGRKWIERCATSARLAFASNRFAEKPPAEVGENEHDPRAHTRTGRDRALERCRLRTGDRRACRTEAAAAQFRVPTLGPGVARCLRVTRSRPAEHAVRQRKTVLTRLAQGAPPSPPPSQDQSRHRSSRRTWHRDERASRRWWSNAEGPDWEIAENDRP